MSKIVRGFKNVTKGYSATQVKVRDATSNDPWGPTGKDMSDIAHMTFDTGTDFIEIMDMLDKRLNDKGKNWRHVLKALKVLDYCLHEGSEHVVAWARENIYLIKTLREFQHIDEEGRDQGMNVRVAAKELTSLLLDEERLRHERKDRKSWKARVSGIEGYDSSSNGYSARADHDRRHTRRHSNPTPRGVDREEWEMRMAIEASKNQAEEDRKRQSRTADPTDEDLAKAIKLSKEEEERRQRELEQSNADALFDDIPVQPAQPQQQPQFGATDYQQGPMVDLWGNPINQQSTGYLNTIYAQPTAQFPGQQYPQPTGFDMQQALQQQQQQGYMAPLPAQPTGFNPQNPYMGNGNMNQQDTSFLGPGTNNPYQNGLQPQAQQQQPLPTGSNNPFAPKVNTFGTQSPPRTGPPSLATLAEQQAQNQFSQFQQQAQQTPFNHSFSSSSTPVPQPQQQAQKPTNPQHAQLEALLQSGNGLDTFGNTGDLRIPAQHTAPGMFVNSAGLRRGPMPGQPTGNNPYLQQGGFTGVPQTTGFGSNLQAPTQNRLVPAHTGPAGMGGGGFSNNPFGQPPGQQQQQGNLIDF